MRPSRRSALMATFLVLCSLFICLAILEATLQIFPELIPPSYLRDFNRDVAKAVARERRLFFEDNNGPRIDRDDGGPPLRLLPSNKIVTFPAVAVDRQYGAVEGQPIDALGSCNPQVPVQADIVTLGDSFTWCTAVRPDQSWTAVLGDLLDATTYSVSRPAIGLYEYVQLYRAIGANLKPEIVILAFYYGNDLRDAIYYSDAVGRKGEVEDGRSREDESGAGDSGAFGQWVLQETWLGRLRSLNLLLVGIPNATRQVLLHVGLRKSKLPNFRYSLEVQGRRIPFNVANSDADEAMNAMKLRDGEIALDVLADALERFAALSRKDSFLPVLIAIPSAYSAYEDSVIFHDPMVGLAALELHRRQREYLEDITRKLGIYYVDVESTLKEQALSESEALYFPHNVHLTASGHRAIALTLKRSLLSILRHACSKAAMSLRSCRLLGQHNE